MLLVLLDATRIGKPILGVVIPLLIFIISFGVSWLLYKHFSKNL
jgi:hypothetical protein